MSSTSAAPPRRLTVLTVAALGVVFGDIGTSPLYALRECFSGVHAIAVTPANVLGNARRTTSLFKIPADRVVEIGIQFEL